MTVLIVVGGISTGPYIKELIKQTNLDLSAYEKICQVDYDNILDQKYQWVPFYNKLRPLDVHGDWWQFAFHESIRKQIREKIKYACDHYGPESHTLTHSLGSWALLGCDVKVDKSYIFGCPMGFSLKFCRDIVQKELSKSIALKTNKLVYCYNPLDRVSQVFPPMDLLSATSSNVKVFNTGSGHGLVQYVNSYLEEIDDD